MLTWILQSRAVYSVLLFALGAWLALPLAAQQPQSSGNKIVIIERTIDNQGNVTDKVSEMPADQGQERRGRHGRGPCRIEVEAENLMDAVEFELGNIELMLEEGAEELEIELESLEEDIERLSDGFRRGQGHRGMPPAHAQLGIGLDMTEQVTDSGVERWVVVDYVVVGSPAEQVGILAGDRIVMMGKTPVQHYRDVMDYVRAREVGQTIEVTIERDGKQQTFQAVLAARPLPPPPHHHFGHREIRKDFFQVYRDPMETIPCDRPLLGVYVRTHQGGAHIERTIENTPAIDAGLLAADLIVQVNDKMITSSDDLMAYIATKKPGDRLKITYIRDGAKKTTRATLRNRCPQDEQGNDAAGAGSATELADKAFERLDLGELNLYPNPVVDVLNLRFTAPARPTTVSVLDLNGKEVYRDNRPAFDGNYNGRLDLAGLNSGVYFLNVIQEGSIYTEKIVVSK